MLLAIDTSTRRIGVAVFKQGQVLNEMVWTSPFHHTVELAPAVELALQRAGIGVADLAGIGVALGPGSFTALRVGLAFVKGLALASSLPLAGIPSLDVIAAGQPPLEIPLLAILEAGRSRLAAGRYTRQNGRWQASAAPQLLTIEAVNAGLDRPTWVCGEIETPGQALLAGNPHARLASPAQNVRRPSILAELAWARLEAGKADDPAALAPLYLSQDGAPG